MRAPHVTLLALALLASATSAQDATARADRGSKIHPEVLRHARQKERRAGETDAALVERLHAARLDAHDLEREECVLYVRARLTDAEVEGLLRRGIEVIEGTWVPPLPGSHPHGFHVAEVPYAALDVLERDARIVRVESAEERHEPHNDTASQLIGVRAVQAGVTGSVRTGAGVRIAVADSSFDLSHPDLPVPVSTYDVTDGNGQANWGSNVSSTASGHGTHVLGTLGGDGDNSGGTYRGAAIGASYWLFKIGNDCNAGAAVSDEIEALNHAVGLNCDIFSMSYGGTQLYMDGSEAMEQAIDVASNAGVACFISAGNAADDRDHESALVAPGASTTFGFFLSNANGTTAATGNAALRVVWRDDSPTDGNVTLALTNAGTGEALSAFGGVTTSNRNTEARTYTLSYNLAAGQAKFYNLQVNNGAASGTTPRVHLYSIDEGVFQFGDPTFTVSSPAVADRAIAVAAWVHRSTWTDWQGNTQTNGRTVGTRADFSSIGPRIDGAQKPQIAAPGAEMISVMDSGNGPANTFTCPGCTGGCLASSSWSTFPLDRRRIDDDGLNLNGSGPSTYYAIAGTSMACPMAAGVGALVLEEDPTLTPAELLGRLQDTASRSSNPDDEVGFGLIDAVDAVRSAQTNVTWVDFDNNGFESGTYGEPWNTLIEGYFFSSTGGTIRMKASTTSETLVISAPRTLEAFGGTVVLGE